MSALSRVEPTNRFSTSKVALFVILASESVFFATLLVAYAALRDQNNWPMDHSLSRLAIPLLNTAILLLSLIPAARAVKDVRREKPQQLQTSLLLTLVLGLVFVGGQIYEFGHAGLRINDQAFGGVFFTLMGFHALHVLAGEVFLIINFVRARLGDFSALRYDSVEVGSWFWYYVVSIWLVLFAALYLI